MNDEESPQVIVGVTGSLPAGMHCGTRASTRGPGRGVKGGA